MYLSNKRRSSWQSTARAAVTTLAAFSLTAATPALASDDTAAALEKFQTVLQNEPNLSSEFKQGLQDVITAIRQEQDAEWNDVVHVDPDDDAFSEHRTRMHIFGDARLRGELNANLDDAPTRFRPRARFRIGMRYDITDNLVAAARVITGNADDPNSPHRDLGGGLNSWDISFDQVYLEYSPTDIPGLVLTGGKFAHPFVRNPVYGALVWDEDVHPEGYKLTYTREDVGPFDRLTFAKGGYILQEQSSGDEALLFAFQGTVEDQLTDELSVMATLGYYHYVDVDPDGSTFLASGGGSSVDNADSAGFNMLGPDGQYLSDFYIVNPIVAFTWTGWEPHPVTLSGELIHNAGAVGGQDLGGAVGVAVKGNMFDRPYTAYYQWQLVEREAVFAPFAGDDFLFPTNREGHVTGIRITLHNNVVWHLWTLFSAVDVPDPTDPLFDSRKMQVRFRSDLNVKL